MVASARWALDHGAAVRARTRHGSTPLCFAASTSENICRLLVGAPGGALDLAETNNYGWSPMYWAVLNRRVHIQRFLLLQGGPVRREDFPETLTSAARRRLEYHSRLQLEGQLGYVRLVRRDHLPRARTLGRSLTSSDLDSDPAHLARFTCRASSQYHPEVMQLGEWVDSSLAAHQDFVSTALRGMTGASSGGGGDSSSSSSSSGGADGPGHAGTGGAWAGDHNDHDEAAPCLLSKLAGLPDSRMRVASFLGIHVAHEVKNLRRARVVLLRLFKHGEARPPRNIGALDWPSSPV